MIYVDLEGKGEGVEQAPNRVEQRAATRAVAQEMYEEKGGTQSSQGSNKDKKKR